MKPSLQIDSQNESIWLGGQSELPQVKFQFRTRESVSEKMSGRNEQPNPQLRCAWSDGRWAIRQEHSRKTNEPVSHIVSRALADYLQVSHSTLYQVSTATALVEGIYQGAVRVRTLREHGDLGLGTFENLDGEMVIVDGRCFQARSEGLVREVDDNVLAPFAVITRFAPDPAIVMQRCPDLSHLLAQFDQLRHSDNFFFALRVQGHFSHVRTRAMCRTAEAGPLTQAAAVQPRFEV